MSELACSNCQKVLDITGIDPFTRCECPECGAKFTIPFEFGHILLQSPIERRCVFDVYEGYDTKKEMSSIVYILDDEIEGYDEALKLAGELAKTYVELRNEHISPVVSFGEFGGRFYVTEPQMDGYDLSSYDPESQQSLLELDNVIEIMKNIGLALAKAHHHELVHHGVAPANVHIDARGNVRLKNFFMANFIYRYSIMNGLAHEVSPYFISPEKVEEGSEDKRGDVFSYGAVFYYLLTGKYPYEGKTENETLYCRVKQKPKQKEEIFSESKPDVMMVSSKDVPFKNPELPDKLRPEVNEGLSNILMRTLKYEPGPRPAIPQILDVINLYQAFKEKEQTINAAQKQMVLTKTVMVVPNRPAKEKKVFGLFKL